MIQLVFDAADAAAALETEPREVGFSQHEGAERAVWTDEAFLPVAALIAALQALAMAFVALTTAHVYFDALVHERLEPRAEADVLPAEIDARLRSSP